MEDVSDSAKLRIRSRNDGVDPVVIALILGIVMVGEVAWAVKGMASPFEIRLRKGKPSPMSFEGFRHTFE